ncbi:MAG: complex I NDUFA9 subunit family protein [Phenylobacterium zucineum]|nr:MAG: complex I NDUFA9 subunit family protein [Phenylobacterium zucineum]
MQNLVTVFGGSGFVGSQVVRALARQGAQVRVAVRQPHLAHTLRLLGDVGQIEVVQANIRNPASVRRALEGAGAAVNLVGLLYESGRQKFQSLHAMGARNVAKAAREVGLATLVQMSAIGADETSEAKYARTKAMGEAAVREEFPQAIIIRPSIIFGQGDGFFNLFAQMAVFSPVLPLIGGGHTRFQPVFVGDVAKAVARVIADPGLAGKTFELGGPGVFSFREILGLINTQTERHRLLLPLPFPIAEMIGKVGELASLVALTPPLTRDQVELLKTDNIASGAYPGLSDLGLTPTPVEAILPTYLYRFRKGGQYADETERLAAKGA